MNGQVVAGAGTVLYAPQYVVGSSWRTTLSVVNLDAADGTVTMRFIDNDGNQIGEKVEQIKARAKIYITDQKYFVDSRGALIQGYLEINSSGPRLVGSVVFGDPGRSQFSASLPLVSIPRNIMIFSQVASDATWFTGLAIVNSNASAVAVTIEVFNRNGERIAGKIESIAARKRKSSC